MNPIDLTQSPALSLGIQCYPGDFVGPLPPGATYCTDPFGNLLNSQGQPMSGGTQSSTTPASMNWTPIIYAALAVIGLLALASIARGR